MRTYILNDKTYNVGEVSVSGIIRQQPRGNKLLIKSSDGTNYAVEGFEKSRFHPGEKLAAIFKSGFDGPVLLTDQEGSVVYSAPFSQANRNQPDPFVNKILIPNIGGILLSVIIGILTLPFVGIYVSLFIVLVTLSDYHGHLKAAEKYRNDVEALRAIVAGDFIG